MTFWSIGLNEAKSETGADETIEREKKKNWRRKWEELQ